MEINPKTFAMVQVGNDVWRCWRLEKCPIWEVKTVAYVTE